MNGKYDHTELLLLTADIDDESPQVLATIPARALAMGARDAVLIPILMKKGRPGTRVEILANPEQRGVLMHLLLTETSTLGVRVTTVERYALQREMHSIELHGGTIAVKVAVMNGIVLRAVPEFDDCERVAAVTCTPVRQILEEARAQALREFPPGTKLS